MTDTVMASTSTTGVYVYCVVRAASKPGVAVAEARLPEASAPRTVPLGRRTWMITADVPLEMYGATPLEKRIENLDWVAAIGVAHQAMVDACMKHDAVVPMKVFTIFKTLGRARGEMQRHSEQLQAAMSQVAGCVEWGVRVTRATQPVRDLKRRTPEVKRAAKRPPEKAPPGKAAATAAAGATSGTAFLESKVRQRSAAREEIAVLDQHLRTLTDTLHDVTRDVRYRHDPAPGTMPVLLDAAYLVPRQSEKQFRAQVRAKSRPLLARGCRVTVTGPWPAYSFVSPAGH